MRRILPGESSAPSTLPGELGGVRGSATNEPGEPGELGERAGERERIRLQPINSRYAPKTYDREEVAGLYRAVQVMRAV